MSLLFERYVGVSIESIDGTAKTIEHDVSKDKLFRIDFESNFKGNATIKLYNVLPETIKMCEPKKNSKGRIEKFPKMKLIAGYKNDKALLSYGDIIQFQNTIQGTDRIFEIKILPNTNIFNTIAIQKNYSGTWISILKQMLSDNSIDYYEIDSAITTTDNVDQFIVNSTLGIALGRICKAISLEYFFDVNKLVIVPKGQKRKSIESESIVLSNETGLIGTPTKKGFNWSAKSLLNSKIKKGSQVNMEFKNVAEKVNDTYTVIDGKHYGSSWTNDFYTEFEAKQL